MTIDADGVPNPWGKVFNQSYPGPWIRMSSAEHACYLLIPSFN